MKIINKKIWCGIFKAAGSCLNSPKAALGENGFGDEPPDIIIFKTACWREVSPSVPTGTTPTRWIGGALGRRQRCIPNLGDPTLSSDSSTSYGLAFAAISRQYSSTPGFSSTTFNSTL